MKSVISLLSYLLKGVSKDTYIWGAGVMIGAVILSISLFVDPIGNGYFGNSTIVNAKEVLAESAACDTEEDTEPVTSEYGELVDNVLKAEQELKEAENDSFFKAGIEDKEKLICMDGLSVSLDEFDALCSIVHCEAESEDLHGKILIADVILNRVDSEQYPNNIKEVIEQKGQFDPVTSRAYYKAVPAKESIDAVLQALNGADYSEGALYFQKSDSREWGDYQYLFRYGAHSFYK